MKKLLILIFALTTIAGVSQQNSKLSQNLLMAVQSGHSALPGTNLVTNGTFDTATTGWVAQDGTLSVESGKLKVTNVGAANGRAYTEISVVSGETYIFQFAYQAATSTTLAVGIGTTTTYPNWWNIYNSGTLSATTLTNHTIYFKALATGTYYVYVVNLDSENNLYAYFDNIVIRKINATALTLPDPAYSLTNTNAIPTYGHKGNSSYWQFDGVDDKITISQTRPTGAYSVVTYIRPRSIGAEQHIAEFAGSQSYINSSGKFVFGDNAGIVSNTTLVANTWYCVTTIFDGANVKLYINGVSDATPVADAVTLSADYLYVGAAGGASFYFNGDIGWIRVFNYDLSATTGLVAYYSNPANHLKAVDQGATGVELVTNGTFTGGTTGWTLSAGWAYGTNNVTYTGSSYNEMHQNFLTSGKYYRLGVNISSIANTLRIWAGGNAAYTAYTTTGVKSTQLLCDGSSLLIEANGNTTIDDVSAVQLGCLLDLTAEGMISPTLWRDYYHNVDIALSGATAPRLVRQGNLTGWRFNGTDSYLSKTGASDGLAGDITISGRIFLSSYGEGSEGIIFSNGHLIVYCTGGYLIVTNDGYSHVGLTAAVLTTNTWTHFVITKNSSGTVNLYLNGSLSGSPNQSAGTPASGTNYYVGNSTVGDKTFDGVIEGFSITKGIWSAEQIALSYSAYQE